MAVDVKMNLAEGRGRTIDAMYDVIELRRKELGETTAQACIAMTIGVLKSLRAATKTAKTSAHISVTNTDDRFTPSWSRSGGGKPRRVLREGRNGAQVNPKKVVWNVGPFVRGEVVHSYEVVDSISEELQVKYIYVTKGGQGDAVRFAKARHKRIVMKHRGLGKLALGIAMRAVSHRENPTEGKVSEEARKVGMKVAQARVMETGFNSGKVNVHVDDNLNYAALALKGGEGYVETAVQKALNAAVGYFNRTLAKKGIDEPLDAPFPEVRV